jgi:hypothetical protein
MSVEKAASTPGLPAGDEEALATRARTTSSLAEDDARQLPTSVMTPSL